MVLFAHVIIRDGEDLRGDFPYPSGLVANSGLDFYEINVLEVGRLAFPGNCIADLEVIVRCSGGRVVSS
jgi:hypothetical protein